jgi:probable F420-dependent oxidoreductase
LQTIPEGTVVYGIQLPIQAQSTLFAADWELSAGPDELAQVARTADESGYYYVGVCDHVAIPRRLAPAMSTTWFDTVATLGSLAGITTNVRLLSHVYVLAYRHAAQSAHAFATLDHLSGGRVILGVGAGHVAEEFELFGLDFTKRGHLLDERIDQVKLHLSHEFVDDLGSSPRPTQQPRPPIWIGGSSKAAIRRAGLLGDGWLPQGTPKKDMPDAIRLLTTTRDLAGISNPCAIGAITDFIYVGPAAWDVGDALTGAPDQIAESLREYVAMGVSHLQVRFKARSATELCDQMTAFGSLVAPLLND